MSQITLKFDGDDADAAKAIDNLNTKMQKLADENRKLQEASKKSSDSATSGYGMAAQSLASWATGMVSVTTAINVGMQALAKWNAESEKLGQNAKKLNEQFTQTAIATGNIDSAEALRRATSTARGATTAQTLEAFRGAGEAVPSMAVNDLTEIARQAAPLGVTGFTPRELASGAAGIKDMAPSVGAGDAVDLSLMLRQKAGANYGKLEADNFSRGGKQLIGSGALDAAHALAFGVEAASEALPKGTVPAIAEAMTQQYQNKGKNLTADQRLQNEFSKLSAPARFEKLTQDPKYAKAVLGESIAQGLGLVEWDRYAKNAADFAGQLQPGNDYRLDVIEKMKADPTMNAVYQGQQGDVRMEAAQRFRAQQAAQVERAKQFSYTWMEERGMAGPINNAAVDVSHRLSTMLGRGPEGHITPAVGKEAADEFMRLEATATAQLAELKKQTELQRQSMRAKGNPNVHSEGQ